MNLEEFNRLSKVDKGKNYEKLSNHDKFLVRISQPPVIDKVKKTTAPLTDEDIKALQELENYSNRIMKKDT